jgi:hypothetical protein
MYISPVIPIAAGSALALGCLIAAFVELHRKRIIDDIPTSKAQGVFIGLAELKGTAESETPLTSFLASVRCVQYAWYVEEHWQRTVTESYRDSQGHTQTRTRTESGWTRVANGGEACSFYLKDDTGVIRVVPGGARIEAENTFNQTVAPAAPLYYDKGPAGAIANSTHQRRFHETAVLLHAKLYVMGQAREREDIVAPEIARDKSSSLFLISVRSEKQISSGYGRWSWFWLVLGLIIAVGAGVGGMLVANAGSWAPVWIMLAGYLAALFIGWLWTVYNSLIGLRNRVNQAWSQVDIQLKRRHDLIPNLVQAVEGYRTNERDTQTVLAELRGQMEATPPGVPGPDFRGLASLIRVTVEQYPDLKSSESFLKLQQSLVDTEQRIALARDFYNDIATFYNTRLSIIPDRFAASLARLGPYSLLEASDFERAPVDVKLVT